MINNVLNKAKNIIYKNGKTVEQALDECLGDLKEWKPDVTTYTSNRCYYVKTKNTVKVWFSLRSNKEITNNSGLVICSDIKTTFGVNSSRYAWNKGLVINNSSVFIDGVIAIKNNEIYFEYAGTNIPNGSYLYGFIEFGIS